VAKALTIQQKALTLRQTLEQRKAELAAALPQHVNVERVMRSALTELSRNPKLLDCTPASFYLAVMEAAQLGLYFGVQGLAYLIPFKDKRSGKTLCQFVPGYVGLKHLAEQSDRVLVVEARTVYERDHLELEYGLQAKLVHRPYLQGDRGSLVGAYAIGLLRDGPKTFVYLTRAEIEQHRARSRAANSGPWVTDYDAMARKTAIRVLCKILPTSTDDRLQRALAADEEHAGPIDVTPAKHDASQYWQPASVTEVLDVPAEPNSPQRPVDARSHFDPSGDIGSTSKTRRRASSKARRKKSPPAEPPKPEATPEPETSIVDIEGGEPAPAEATDKPESPTPADDEPPWFEGVEGGSDE